eukprot:7976845-Alexandrium_andersonii.AAC.1
MSASLVGSEMCIRDSPCRPSPARQRRGRCRLSRPSPPCAGCQGRLRSERRSSSITPWPTST